METIRGSTAIDTVYELKGFQLADAFAGAFFWLAVAVFVGFGILAALYRAGDKGRYRGIAVYIVQALVVIWLLQPIMVNVMLPAGFVLDKEMSAFVGREQPSVRAPRILAWSHIAIDAVARLLVGSVNDTFAERPYELERAALLLRKTRIANPDLRRRYQAFVVSCYVPASAEAARTHAGGGTKPHEAAYYDPFVVPDEAYAGFAPYTPEGVPADQNMRPRAANQPMVTCTAAKHAIHAELALYVRNDRDSNWAYDEVKKLIRRVLREETRRQGYAGDGGDTAPIVLRYVLYNETLGLLNVGEIAYLQAAVPDYGMFHTSQQTANNPQGVVDWVRTIVSFFVKAAQSVDQWIDHHAEGPALYYKVVCFAPYVYGLSSMIMIAIFPFAGFAALLPGRWTILLTWAKYLLWVKLWLVFWSILAKFNTWRVSLSDLASDPASGIGDQTYIFPAIAAMYLAAPALSLVVVHLLDATAKSASSAVGALAPGGGGGGGFAPMQGAAHHAEGRALNAAGGGGGGASGGAGQAAEAAAV